MASEICSLNDKTCSRHGDLLGTMIAYEQGETDFEETVDLFQKLIDSGMAWSLQGCYGRQAVEFIKRGYCSARPSYNP